MGDVVGIGGGDVAPVAGEINAHAIELCEQLLERLKSGAAVAAAFVEVGANRGVATAWSQSMHYHSLNSGAARLANRLASVVDDD